MGSSRGDRHGQGSTRQDAVRTIKAPAVHRGSTARMGPAVRSLGWPHARGLSLDTQSSAQPRITQAWAAQRCGGREAGPRGAAEDRWGAKDSAHSWKNASSVLSHFPEACEKHCFCRTSLRAFPPPQLFILKTGSGGASWECGAGKRRQCRFPAWMSGWTPEL